MSSPMSRHALLLAIAVLASASSSAWAGGPWTLPAGALSLRGTGSTERAHEEYCGGLNDCGAASRVPFTLDGQWRMRAVFLDADYGLTRRLTLGVSTSLQAARYEDLAGLRTTDGFGDLSMRAQYSLTTWPVAAAVCASVKAPTGKNPIDASTSALIPLSEGQWDGECTLAIGKSLYPKPAYVLVESGYRARSTSHRDDPPRNVGDEVPFRAEGGTMITKHWGARMRVQGFAGFAGSAYFGGVGLRIPARSIVYVAPSVVWHSGTREVEVTLAQAIAGRNYPVTTTLRVGASTQFSLVP